MQRPTKADREKAEKFFYGLILRGDDQDGDALRQAVGNLLKVQRYLPGFWSMYLDGAIAEDVVVFPPGEVYPEHMGAVHRDQNFDYISHDILEENWLPVYQGALKLSNHDYKLLTVVGRAKFRTDGSFVDFEKSPKFERIGEDTVAYAKKVRDFLRSNEHFIRAVSIYGVGEFGWSTIGTLTDELIDIYAKSDRSLAEDLDSVWSQKGTLENIRDAANNSRKWTDLARHGGMLDGERKADKAREQGKHGQAKYLAEQAKLYKPKINLELSRAVLKWYFDKLLSDDTFRPNVLRATDNEP